MSTKHKPNEPASLFQEVKCDLCGEECLTKDDLALHKKAKHEPKKVSGL